MNPVHSNIVFDELVEDFGGHDFSQLALWTAAGLAGMATAVMISRTSFFERMTKRLGKGARSAHPPLREHSLPLLAQAIVGSSKSAIKGVFGPPKSAVLPEIGVIIDPQRGYWQSDTWYYPLGRQGPMAIAISFSEDIAHQVEFFTFPQI